MENNLRILLLEDNEDDAMLIERVLKKSGLNFVSKTVATKTDYVKQLNSFLPNLILSDHSMPSFNSIEALKICKKQDVLIPFILVTGAVSEEFAVDCLKRGADDYILKGNLTRLPSAIESALKQKEAESERQIAMEMLRRSEEHFRKLIENSSDIFAIVHKNNHISYLSPSVERVLGYQPHELRHKNAYEYIHEDDHEEAGEIFVPYLLSDELTAHEIRFKHKNNTWRYLECISKPDSLGDSIIVNIRDVTERKKAEEELKKKNIELEKINKELDSFVYSASHDLKAPLKSLLGLVKLAQYEFEKNTLESFSHYGQLMEKSIVRLDETIQKIVYHSANSRSEIQLEPIDFDAIIHDILDKLVFMDGNNLIKKTVIVEQKKTFNSDKTRITVILNNLISNAIKYSNTLKNNPFILIHITITDKHATIIFEDNGIGIDEEYIDRVFNMFFRATERSEGSGLGLYIVKEIVEKLGGTIKVESKKDEGTKFTVELPNS